MIGRGGVGRGEHREELRHEVDEHGAAGPNLGIDGAGDKRAPAAGRSPARDGRLDFSECDSQDRPRILRLISERKRRSAGVRLSIPRAEILSRTRSISACAGSRPARGGLGAALARAARAGCTSTLGSVARRRWRSARANTCRGSKWKARCGTAPWLSEEQTNVRGRPSASRGENPNEAKNHGSTNLATRSSKATRLATVSRRTQGVIPNIRCGTIYK